MANDSKSRTEKNNAGRAFMLWAYVLLYLIIGLSTYIHHVHPSILSVPDNLDVASWHKPAFEETAVHDRMTEAERRRVLAEGVPQGGDLKAQFATDLFMILVSWFCFIHARANFGSWMASCFFIGSFIFTGLEESIWILSGRYLGGMLEHNPGGTFFGTYWFTKGGFWFIETPLVACLGWFAIAYSCVWVAGRVFPRMGLWGRAVAGGLIAMGTDLWADPVATSPELMNWVWAKGDFFLFFGIPFYNFIGWFLLIFLFAVIWEKLPDMEKRWGRTGASALFLTVCTGGTALVALFIYVVWFLVAGGILHQFGLETVVQIPKGW
jgi:uncharacterized membrane protein